MGKIANRQSLAILDRGLKSQPFSQFCCIGVFKTNRQSRVSNRNFWETDFYPVRVLGGFVLAL